MNCVECRELLPLRADEELDAATAAACDQHLADCPSCRSEYEHVCTLRTELINRGEAAAGIAVVAPVMSRIGATRSRQRTQTWRALTGWLFAAGAVTTAVVALVVTLTAVSPAINAQAVDVLTRGIAAVARLTNVHVEARMRTPPSDNFSAIDASADFVPVTLWREFDGRKRWRVEKPGRVAAMEGGATMLFVRPDYALRLEQPTAAAFDTAWLQKIANIEQMLSSTLQQAQRAGWKMDLARQARTDGDSDVLVTVDSVSGLSARDYLANKFIGTGNLRQVYRFNDASGRLEELQIYLRDTGTLIFETTRIEYNQDYSAATFAIDLPPGVTWSDGMSKPVDGRYTTLTAETAARMFFEACGREDWTEASVFVRSPLTSRWKTALGGIQVISIGESFTSTMYPGRFVPYEITFRTGEVKKFNLALKHDPKTGRWFVDGGL